jgi:predicted nucleic acid-binding protein
MTARGKPLDRYWDSAAFLGLFLDEPGRADDCKSVIKAAQEGRLRIVTSALTLTEVVTLKGYKPLPPEKRQLLRQFFRNPWVILREVDRYTAEEAQDLVWKHVDLKPKDAIHVATAIRAGVQFLDTYDEPLIGLNEQIGDPPLKIGKPGDLMQMPLDMEVGEAPNDDQEAEELAEPPTA